MSSAHDDMRDRLKDMVQTRLGVAWDDLSELWKIEIREALDDVGNLLVVQLTDPKNPVLERELAYAKARVANWSFVGADLVRSAIKEALHEALELLGSFARARRDPRARPVGQRVLAKRPCRWVNLVWGFDYRSFLDHVGHRTAPPRASA